MKTLVDEHALALRRMPAEMFDEFESLDMFEALQFLVKNGPIAAAALLVKIYPFEAYMLCAWMRWRINNNSRNFNGEEFNDDPVRKQLALDAYGTILERLTLLRVPHLAIRPERATPEHFLAWKSQPRHQVV